MGYYSIKTFRYIMYQKGGYNSDEAIALDVMKCIGKSQRQTLNKMRTGFSAAEEKVIASKYEFSPAEYCDCFLHGLFIENSRGHFVAHVENPKALLMPPTRGKSKRKRTEEEILRRLDDLEKGGERWDSQK